MSGWIKLHRMLKDWEWYHDSQMVHLFIHLLFIANYEPSNWRGHKLERGQIITGRKQLANDTGISEQSIRTCLERLKSTNEITIQSTNRFSIITINKYDSYQVLTDGNNQPANQPTPNKQPASNQQLTTSKKLKKPTIEEVKKYCAERDNKVDYNKWYNHYTANGWKVGKNPMKDWKASVRTWEQTKSETWDVKKEDQSNFENL